MTAPASTMVEVNSLEQAITYVKGLIDEWAPHGGGGLYSERYRVYLVTAEVTGRGMDTAVFMQERIDAFVAACRTHLALLENQRVVQQAYDAAPDAGNKAHLTGGR